MHPDDPEARIIQGGGRTHLNYNAQAVVDRDSELIVAAEVVNAESDNEMLVEIMDDIAYNAGRWPTGHRRIQSELTGHPSSDAG